MTYLLRPATEIDFNIIHEWLLEQARNRLESSLYCNWNLTKKVYKRGSLLAFVSSDTGRPHAYMWDDFGVVEVMHSKRGEGIGKMMVEEALKLLVERNIAAVGIHAAPISSKGFWIKMGAEFYTDDRGFIAISKKLDLPTDGKRVDVILRLFKQAMLYNEPHLAHKTIQFDAVCKDGVVYLGERVGIYHKNKLWEGDAGIEILVDGSQVYFGKVKYGNSVGIERDSRRTSFYIDKINQTR